MPNKFEQIAAKQKRAALAKQDADVERFAKKVSEEVLHGIGDFSLKDSVAELATSVAEAIVLSNENIDTKLSDNFLQLLSSIKENKPDNASQIEASLKIGEQLASLESAFAKVELSPTINLEAINADDLREEVGKILALLPKDSQRIVTIAYENASPDKYLNVRLTDGDKFYKASGGGVSVVGGGSGGSLPEGLATEAKQDDIITAIGSIGGAGNFTTRIATVGTLTYIGNAVIGSANSAAVWQIKRLDAASGLIKLWADGNDNYDNIWDNRASLSYS